ncbi:hypothetical protein ACEWY4_022189 [Coilia grayii]|uniref:DUF6729 domain-containing protein n=1 Tax=Coilia grayii TaxID=363190 RepID=A0ABD1J8K7_9TELE
MYAYPVFRCQSAGSARLLMVPSEEAKRLENAESGKDKPKAEVLSVASTFVTNNGGDPTDQFLCRQTSHPPISHKLSFPVTGRITSHLSNRSEFRKLCLRPTANWQARASAQAEAVVASSSVPPLIHTRPPASPNRFFSWPLFLWMPHKMWLFPLVCVRPFCGKHRLTAAGLYRTVCRVLDIDGWYDLATEYLECKRCSKKYPAWSEDILGQLDMGHRSQYLCDIRVLRMMKERTMGNSVTRLYKKLQEQHSEAWMHRVLQYLTACEPFTRTCVVRSVFAEPRLLPALPKPK